MIKQEETGAEMCLFFLVVIKYMQDKDYIGVVAVNSLDFIEKVFECYASGNKVVFLRDVNDRERGERFQVQKILLPEKRYGWFNWNRVLPSTNDIAHVAFTSGTESSPKGVLLTHESLSDVVTRLNQVMEVTDEIREYIGVPANYSFGLGRFRSIACAGGRAYLPSLGFNPLEIRELLRAGQINAISAVPSLWRLLLKGSDIFANETRLVRWIEIGSQYMSHQEKLAIVRLFPNAKIVQHYGLTEASRTTLLRLDTSSERQLESVGRAYGSTEVKVAPDRRIMVRGPHVAHKYILDSADKRIQDEKGWFTTNDLGFMEDGYLFYEGRNDELINCGGVKLSPDAFESKIKKICGDDLNIGVTRISDAIYGDAILLCYLNNLSPEVLENLKKCAARVLDDLGIKNQNLLKFNPVEDIPRTETGKIQRNKLRKNNDISLPVKKESNQDKVEEKNSLSQTENEKTVISYWQRIVPLDRTPNLDANFYDLGGDSLSALNAILELERIGAPPVLTSGILQGLSIREIAIELENDRAQPNSPILSSSAKVNIAINSVRGLIALCVVLAHWSAGIFERLPTDWSILQKIFAPIFSIGTPGFSVIFGISAGYSLYRVYSISKSRFNTIKKRSVWILSLGVLVLASANLLEVYSEAGVVGWLDFYSSFYSVLTFYLAAVLTIDILFSLIKNVRYPVPVLLLISMITYGIDKVVFPMFPMEIIPYQLELLKLMLFAKYGYFNMMCGATIGLAMGYIIFSNKMVEENLASYFGIYGLTSMILGLYISYYAGDILGWFSWPVYTNTLWRWIFYAGSVFLLVSAFGYITSSNLMRFPLIRHLVGFLTSCGMLAFPIFVLHELVLPLRNVLMHAFGIANSISLFLTLGAFLIIFFYALFRVRKMQIV